MPWKVIGCSFVAGEPAGDATGLAFEAIVARGDTLGEGDVLVGAPSAFNERPMLIATRHEPAILRDLCFMLRFRIDGYRTATISFKIDYARPDRKQLRYDQR